MLGDTPLAGLSVEVVPLLEAAGSYELSPPAGPLTVPGTVWIVAGFAIACALVFAAIAAALSNRGRFITRIFTAIRLAVLRGAVRRATKRLAVCPEGERRKTIERLEIAARDYLGIADHADYRSFVPNDFLPNEKRRAFFETCDQLRFRSENVNSQEIASLIKLSEEVLMRREQGSAVPE
jgi:hypothetical protein